MTRCLTAFAATLALALSIGACGGDSGLTKDELIAQGDQICRDGKATIDREARTAFTSSPSRAELEAFFTKTTIPTYRQELSKMKGLDPDGDSEQAWNDIVTKLEQGINQLAQDPMLAMNPDSSPLGKASQAARDFGMKVCGAQD